MEIQKTMVLKKRFIKRHKEYIQKSLDYLQLKTRAWARGENVIWGYNIPELPPESIIHQLIQDFKVPKHK